MPKRQAFINNFLSDTVIPNQSLQKLAWVGGQKFFGSKNVFISNISYYFKVKECHVLKFRFQF